MRNTWQTWFFLEAKQNSRFPGTGLSAQVKLTVSYLAQLGLICRSVHTSVCTYPQNRYSEEVAQAKQIPSIQFV